MLTHYLGLQSNPVWPEVGCKFTDFSAFGKFFRLYFVRPA